MLVWTGLPISSIESHTPLEKSPGWISTFISVSRAHAQSPLPPSLIPYFPAFRAMAITSVAVVIMSSCLQDVFLASFQISESAHYSAPNL